MPRLIVIDSYSHMFGEAVLDRLHPGLKAEVYKSLITTRIAKATKKSREKAKRGKIVWSGKNFNDPLGKELRSKGWTRRKVFYPNQERYYIDVDYAKGGVAVEAQFGKYAFVQHDFAKFRYLFEMKDASLRIDVGIEIVPSAALQKKMYSGVSNFDSVVASLQAHARNDPPVPIWLLAIDVN